MKVLLLNGSSHQTGCVFRGLSEAALVFSAENIENEIFWLGNDAVRGCIGCGRCRELGHCAFRDEIYDAFAEKLKSSDALIIGSPVYYAGPNGSLCAFLDRACYSLGDIFRGKPAGCVVNCRRGGASAAFDRLNKYFTILQMPVVSSQYWNSTHGTTPSEVEEDAEGLQTVRTLARNMAYLLRTMDTSGLEKPPAESPLRTNFIK